jgi:hypothetical protein
LITSIIRFLNLSAPFGGQLFGSRKAVSRRQGYGAIPPSPAVDDEPIATILTGPPALNRSANCESRYPKRGEKPGSQDSDADLTSALFSMVTVMVEC